MNPQSIWAEFEQNGSERAAFADDLIRVWTRLHHPLLELERTKWVRMFEAVGYIQHGTSVERPRETVRLYRGSGADHADGLSWTPDIQVARQFALSRWYQSGQQTFVWTALVRPANVLARLRIAIFTADVRKPSTAPTNPNTLTSDEWVVNIKRSEIQLLEAGVRTPPPRAAKTTITPLLTGGEAMRLLVEGDI
jgi:hypothetical protein